MGMKNKEEFIEYVKAVNEYNLAKNKEAWQPINKKTKDLAKEARDIFKSLMEKEEQLEKTIKVEFEKSKELTAQGYEDKKHKTQRFENVKNSLDVVIKKLASNDLSSREIKKLEEEESKLKTELEIAEKEYNEVRAYAGTETYELGEAEKALDRCQYEKNRMKQFIEGVVEGPNSVSKFIKENYPDLAEKYAEIKELESQNPTPSMYFFMAKLKNARISFESEKGEMERFDVNSEFFIHIHSASSDKMDINFDKNGNIDWTIKSTYQPASNPGNAAYLIELFPETLETLPCATIDVWPKRIFESFENGLNPVTYEKTVDKEKYPTFDAWKEAMQAMKKAKEGQLQQYKKEQEEKNQQGMQ